MNLIQRRWNNFAKPQKVSLTGYTPRRCLGRISNCRHRCARTYCQNSTTVRCFEICEHLAKRLRQAHLNVISRKKTRSVISLYFFIKFKINIMQRLVVQTHVQNSIYEATMSKRTHVQIPLASLCKFGESQITFEQETRISPRAEG